jgi:hypothetical protein
VSFLESIVCLAILLGLIVIARATPQGAALLALIQRPLWASVLSALLIGHAMGYPQQSFPFLPWTMYAEVEVRTSAWRFTYNETNSEFPFKALVPTPSFRPVLSQLELIAISSSFDSQERTALAARAHLRMIFQSLAERYNRHTGNNIKSVQVARCETRVGRRNSGRTARCTVLYTLAL